jgi:hypothetical protein
MEAEYKQNILQAGFKFHHIPYITKRIEISPIHHILYITKRISFPPIDTSSGITKKDSIKIKLVFSFLISVYGFFHYGRFTSTVFY